MFVAQSSVWRVGWGPMKREGREWTQVPESLPTFLGGPWTKRARENPMPLAHHGRDHSSGALWERNYPMSSSTGVAYYLLCAHQHIKVEREDLDSALCKI